MQGGTNRQTPARDLAEGYRYDSQECTKLGMTWTVFSKGMYIKDIGRSTIIKLVLIPIFPSYSYLMVTEDPLIEVDVKTLFPCLILVMLAPEGV